MALDPRRVKALFDAALELLDAAERPAFLDRECNGDRELRQSLEELLAAYDRPASALERPLEADPSAAHPPGSGTEKTAAISDQSGSADDRTATLRPEGDSPASLLGSVIAGRYELRQEIGEGGHW